MQSVDVPETQRTGHAVLAAFQRASRSLRDTVGINEAEGSENATSLNHVTLRAQPSVQVSVAHGVHLQSLLDRCDRGDEFSV